MRKRERYIDQALRHRVKQLDGLYLKLTNPAGIPDRLVLFPGGRAGFIEVKRPGETPRPLQYYWINKLQRMGFFVTYEDSIEGGELFIDKILEG